jgi:hypothetical protein
VDWRCRTVAGCELLGGDDHEVAISGRGRTHGADQELDAIRKADPG